MATRNDDRVGSYMVDLVSDCLLLTASLLHYGHILFILGVSFTLIDVILLLNMRSVALSLYRKFQGYRLFLAMEADLRDRFPTVDNVPQDQVCAICRDPMESAKKLPWFGKKERREFYVNLFFFFFFFFFFFSTSACSCQRRSVSAAFVCQSSDCGFSGTSEKSRNCQTSGQVGFVCLFQTHVHCCHARAQCGPCRRLDGLAGLLRTAQGFFSQKCVFFFACLNLTLRQKQKMSNADFFVAGSRAN